MAYAMATAMAMIARIPTTTYRVHGLPVQSSIPHRPLAARGESLAVHRDGRGAPPARRDDREYREYLSEEQRSRRGCIARRMQPDFHHGLLAPWLEPEGSGHDDSRKRNVRRQADSSAAERQGRRCDAGKNGHRQAIARRSRRD